MALHRTAAKALTSNQFRRQCKLDYLNYLRVREWQDVYTQLHQSTREMGFKLNDEPGSYHAVHSAILVGLLSHIGMKDQEKNEYHGARNARFNIFLPLAYLKAAEMGHVGRAGGNLQTVGARGCENRTGLD